MHTFTGRPPIKMHIELHIDIKKLPNLRLYSETRQDRIRTTDLFIYAGPLSR